MWEWELEWESGDEGVVVVMLMELCCFAALLLGCWYMDGGELELRQARARVTATATGSVTANGPYHVIGLS